MAERTPYPLERMSYDEYMERYSKGEGIDPGLTDDEFYEFERQLYEQCLDKLGVDFEGWHLFDFSLTLRKDYERSHWQPVPRVPIGGTLEQYEAAFDAAALNLDIAHESFKRARRMLRWRQEEQAGPDRHRPSAGRSDQG